MSGCGSRTEKGPSTAAAGLSEIERQWYDAYRQRDVHKLCQLSSGPRDVCTELLRRWLEPSNSSLDDGVLPSGQVQRSASGEGEIVLAFERERQGWRVHFEVRVVE